MTNTLELKVSHWGSNSLLGVVANYVLKNDIDFESLRSRFDTIKISVSHTISKFNLLEDINSFIEEMRELRFSVAELIIEFD